MAVESYKTRQLGRRGGRLSAESCKPRLLGRRREGCCAQALALRALCALRACLSVPRRRLSIWISRFTLSRCAACFCTDRLGICGRRRRGRGREGGYGL